MERAKRTPTPGRAISLLLLLVAGAGCDGNVNDGRLDIAITLRASLDSSAGQGLDDSLQPDLSGDGRYVVFVSDSENLVAADTNGLRDVFRHDLLTGITELVSFEMNNVSSANGTSEAPSISNDGRYVAFHSVASDLVAGGNVTQDVYVRDMQTGSTVQASVDSGGTPGDMNSFDPDMSGDGRFVAFTSAATNLVAADTNMVDDVFRHEISSGTTIRVNLTFTGAEATGVSPLDVIGLQPGSSGKPSISDDGSVIAFESGAAGLVLTDFPLSFYRDIFVRDVSAGTTTRVSVEDPGNPDGNPLDSDNPNGNSRFPSISGNGRTVAFVSFAPDLVPFDANGLTNDVFLYDLDNPGPTDLISVNTDGTQAVSGSEEPVVSGDGRYVSFSSGATNLVLGDTNLAIDVFFRDRLSGTTVRVSVGTNGFQTPVFAISSEPSISDDGRFVSFTSDSSTLVNDDSNGRGDVFVRGPLF